VYGTPTASPQQIHNMHDKSTANPQQIVQEAQLMPTTGSTRLAVNQGQQT